MTSPFTTNPIPKIPPRPPASTTLWAHLFRTGTEGIVSDETALGRVVPPLTPLDKTGTSMRMLLHDTQARFEQFSARIDTLLVGVRDAHAGIVRVQEMFERGHEDLGGDITGLINRSQTLVQKSIGNPAQGEELDQLRKDVGHKLEALDKRLDAMHLCNQSHAQTLQIQSRALQTLQEQQGTILAAVMPILPLVQALPLYVDAAKTFIVEACKGSCGGTSIPSMSEKGTAASPSSRKRSNSTISDGPPPSPYNAKRQRRLDAFRTGSGGLRKPVVQLDSLGVHVDELGPSPRQTTLSSLATHPPRRRSTIVTQTTKTPRKSLVELSPALLGNTPLDEKDSQEAPVLHAALGAGGGELTKERTVSSERSEGQQGARPREKQVQSMTSDIVPSSVHPQVPPVTSCSATHLRASAVSTVQVLRSSITPTPEEVDAPDKNRSTPHAMAPPPIPIPRSRTVVPVKDIAGAGIIHASLRNIQSVYVMPSRVRKRRSPLREGRRFIPLDDSDEDSDG